MESVQRLPKFTASFKPMDSHTKADFAHVEHNSDNPGFISLQQTNSLDELNHTKQQSQKLPPWSNKQQPPIPSPDGQTTQRLFQTPALLEQSHLTRKLSFAAHSEPGYRYLTGNRDEKMPLHSRNEDYLIDIAPAPNLPAQCQPFHIWILSDGHGGSDCADFISRRLSSPLYNLMTCRLWNLADLNERMQLKKLISEIFVQIDRIFLLHKEMAFRKWKQETRLGCPTQKPADAGATCQVTILMGNWLINCNVGDSRTVLLQKHLVHNRSDAETTSMFNPMRSYQGKRSSPDRALPTQSIYRPFIDAVSNSTRSISTAISNSFNPTNTRTDDAQTKVQTRSQGRGTPTVAWVPIFTSQDHTPGHPNKAYQIHTNGGQFITSFGKAVTPIPTISHPSTRAPGTLGSYTPLVKSRIRRPADFVVDKDMDVSIYTTLNLAGTMGDLLFKLNPPLLSAAPDIEFIELRTDSYHTQQHQQQSKSQSNYNIEELLDDYIMIMASDGLWDHLLEQTSANDQNWTISQYVGEFWERLCQYKMDIDEGQSWNENLALNELCHLLCDREGESGLFQGSVKRFDDVTAVVAHISPPK